MTRYVGEVRPGDILVTREGNKLISGFIRLGAALTGFPAKCNHVIIVHHRDSAGTWWGIEGRPGGVGWRDLTEPIKGALTISNNWQIKTEEQRYLIAASAEELLRVETPYDWAAITEHTRMVLSLWKRAIIAQEWNEKERPAQVVCSSFADWAYEKVGLDNPGGSKVTRMTTPGQWDKFIQDRKFNRP